MVSVKFVDLFAQYLSIKDEINNAIQEVIQTSAYIRGSYVDLFENNFASTIGSPFCVSCGNGTDALYIAMKSLGLKSGDEVIVPAHTWISSAEAVTQAGGKVVFCDTNIDNFTICPESLESKVSSRTVGIIPVHLFGQAADMDAVVRFAEKHKLWILEDCAQAHLARYNGKTVGTFGNVAAYSFYPGKNLGAMGDAGALITSDADLARRMTMFARHGGMSKGDHQIEGINSRMDGLQAAILLVKLKYLDSWTSSRRALAENYQRRLRDVPGVLTPKEEVYSDHVWHLYVIKHRERDRLIRFLGERQVETTVNYRVALPFLPAYKYLKHIPQDFPNSYSNQDRILSIPIFPELTSEQQDWIISSISEFN